MTDEVIKSIEQTIHRDTVVLFMKGTRTAPQCGFSARVVQILDSLLADYTTVDVLMDQQVREGIKRYSSWPTIPQLFVRGEFIGGCDIVTELFQTGSLQQKLGVDAQELPQPEIVLTPKAAAAFRAALESPDERVRLEINSAFQHSLSITTSQPGDIQATVAGVPIALDRGSANRADGVRIDYVETPTGPAFKVTNPSEPPRVRSLSVEELQHKLAADDGLRLIDVRTPEERNLAAIEGSEPLDEPGLSELERDSTLVFYCHHGLRSRAAAEQFLARGFSNVFNLEGGIDAWSERIDPSVPRY